METIYSSIEKIENQFEIKALENRIRIECAETGTELFITAKQFAKALEDEHIEFAINHNHIMLQEGMAWFLMQAIVIPVSLAR